MDLKRASERKPKMPPATTRAAQYLGEGVVQLIDAPLPAPGPGEITVRIDACGICTSELLRWYADGKAPFVLGHEPVGEVVACGDASPFAIGQRVFIHHHAPCMQCRRCRRGDYVQCDTWRATRLQPGGMSEFATVPNVVVQHDMLAVPPHVSDEAATLIEPLATVVKSVRRSGLRRGDRPLIIGAGAMGMLHMLVARAYGAQQIIAADRSRFRLNRAAQFGATSIVDVGATPLADAVRAATDAQGAEAVFVTPGSREALDAAMGCVAPGGTVVVFTPLRPGELWPVDVNDLFFKDLNIVSSYSAGPDDTREALQLLADGLVVEPLFTHRFRLAEVQQAYKALSDTESSLKVVVYPSR